jgi:hypothetical protein
MKNRDRLFMAGGVERSQLGETAGCEPGRVRDKKPVEKHLTS